MIEIDVQSSVKGLGWDSLQSPLISVVAIVIIYAITHTYYTHSIKTHVTRVRLASHDAYSICLVYILYSSPAISDARMFCSYLNLFRCNLSTSGVFLINSLFSAYCSSGDCIPLMSTSSSPQQHWSHLNTFPSSCSVDVNRPSNSLRSHGLSTTPLLPLRREL